MSLLRLDFPCRFEEKQYIRHFQLRREGAQGKTTTTDGRIFIADFLAIFSHGLISHSCHHIPTPCPPPPPPPHCSSPLLLIRPTRPPAFLYSTVELTSRGPNSSHPRVCLPDPILTRLSSPPPPQWSHRRPILPGTNLGQLRHPSHNSPNPQLPGGNGPRQPTVAGFSNPNDAREPQSQIKMP